MLTFLWRTTVQAGARALAGVLLVLVTALAHASGASGSPIPDCQGPAFSASTGDHQLGEGVPPPNLDIIGGFFTMSDAKPYATIELSDLTLTPPPGAEGILWAMHFTGELGNPVVVYARSDFGAAPGFFYEFAPDQPYATDGTVYPGPNGIMQIDAEASYISNAIPGMQLTQPWAEADALHQPPGLGDAFDGAVQLDRQPGTGFGNAYTVSGPCPRLAILTGYASARGAQRAGAVLVRLQETGTYSTVTITLERGIRPILTARAGHTAGRAVVKLPVRRKPRTGTYTLRASATDGSTGSVITTSRRFQVGP